MTMTDTQIAHALRRHADGEKLDQGRSKFLYEHGYVEGSTTVTNLQSREKEYLLTFITEKGKAVMDRVRA
jgi:hypothetical protein